MSDWERTIADLQTLAETFSERGWDVISTPAGHLGVATPSPDSDRWGLIPIIPGDVADQIDGLADVDTFDQATVYRQQSGGRAYLVIQYRDEDRTRLIQFAGSCEVTPLRRVTDHAAEAGGLPVHLRRLSGEYVASFTHDDWETFVTES